MKRLLRWLQGGVRTPAPVPVGTPGPAGNAAPPALASASVPEAAPGQAPPAPDLQYFAWLTQSTPHDSTQLSAHERRLLEFVDVVSASDEERQALVPRARAIVPQLMKSLRDETQSVQALSARVARDPNLVVEVLRMANAPGYRSDTPVEDLTQAIARLGTDGLRNAIARVLLKPIFDAQADPLVGRTAERLWQHSEAKAGLCQQTARVARVEPFDAYLAGLMHNVGWTACFRALDRSRNGVPAALSAAFVRALAPRRDRLFALLVQSWQLSDTMTALAGDILANGFAAARLPLATLLQSADRAAFLQLLRAESADPTAGGSAAPNTTEET